MGNNCTCLTSKDDMADLNIIQTKSTKILRKLPLSKNIFL